MEATLAVVSALEAAGDGAAVGCGSGDDRSDGQVRRTMPAVPSTFASTSMVLPADAPDATRVISHARHCRRPSCHDMHVAQLSRLHRSQ